MLQGIRIIKFYAWEGPFAAIVRKARAAEEYPILKHAYWMMMGLQAIFLQIPNLLLLSVFATHVLRNGSMEPAVVWVTIMLFQLLQQPITQLPNALSQSVQTMHGLDRIGTFLKLPDMYEKTKRTKRTKNHYTCTSACGATHTCTH